MNRDDLLDLLDFLDGNGLTVTDQEATEHNLDVWIAQMPKITDEPREPTNMTSYYLIYPESGHPAPMAGPYPTEIAALTEYRKRLVDAGADIDDDEDIYSLYLEDDSALIGRL